MPRRTPQIINGQNAAWYDERLHNEYNVLVDLAGVVYLRANRWHSDRWTNNWSGVRWRAQRVADLRRRIELAIDTYRWSEHIRGRLPNPSLVDSLPREWWENGIEAPSTRRSRNGYRAVVDVSAVLDRPLPATSQIALETVALEPDFEQYTFGVELECYLQAGMTRNDMARILSENGILATAEEYNHFRRNHWKLVTDGSLSDYMRGMEVVSPVLRGQAGLAEMRKVCKLLDGNGVTVQRSCGFHVHVGARERPVQFFRNLLNLYAHYEGAIDSLTSRSRRANNNAYCHSTKYMLSQSDRKARIDAAETVLDLASAYSGTGFGRRPDDINRMMKVNLASFWRHGTVEFRQHQGTINPDKTEHWVKVCLRMVAAAAAGLLPDGEDTLKNLADKIQIPADEMAFLEKRVVELEAVRPRR